MSDDAIVVLYSVPEAARALSISRSTLYELHKQGRIAFVKLGRRSFVRRDDLNAFVDSLSTEP